MVALYRAQKSLSTRLSGRLFSLGRLEKFFGVTYNTHSSQIKIMQYQPKSRTQKNPPSGSGKTCWGIASFSDAVGNSNQRRLKMKSSTLLTPYRITVSATVFMSQIKISNRITSFPLTGSEVTAMMVALYRAQKSLSTRLSGRIFSLQRCYRVRVSAKNFFISSRQASSRIPAVTSS